MVIKKSFRAEMAHRLQHCYTKRCLGLHGHSYVFTIYLKGTTQDDAQMLMDFTLVKERYHNFLDSFDHSILIWREDSELLEQGPLLNPRYIVVPYNTTAEQIARHIYYEGKQLELPVWQVEVSETATASAVFSGDDSIAIELDAVYFSPAIRENWR